MPPYVFIKWWSIKHRDIFTFVLLFYTLKKNRCLSRREFVIDRLQGCNVIRNLCSGFHITPEMRRVITLLMLYVSFIFKYVIKCILLSGPVKEHETLLLGSINRDRRSPNLQFFIIPWFRRPIILEMCVWTRDMLLSPWKICRVIGSFTAYNATLSYNIQVCKYWYKAGLPKPNKWEQL
jgi:hypothetical protein